MAALLHKDPAQRPSAKAALRHPWLRGTARERSIGRPLSLAVVQRIQARQPASRLFAGLCQTRAPLRRAQVVVRRCSYEHKCSASRAQPVR